jgi:hypothetical protein
MAKEIFAPSRPHNHYCSECGKPVYCANLKCELPQRSECQECKRGFKFETREGMPGYYRERPKRFEDDNETRRI